MPAHTLTGEGELNAYRVREKRTPGFIHGEYVSERDSALAHSNAHSVIRYMKLHYKKDKSADSYRGQAQKSPYQISGKGF
jgi:hypothetical protein